MSNRVNSKVISGSGGNFLFYLARLVQHGNLLIIILSIKFSKFPPVPEITPELTALDKRARKQILPDLQLSIQD